MRAIVLGIFAASAVSCASAGQAAGRSAVLRDVEGYAIASCMAMQSEPYLKDQGDAWASVIVQRARGEITDLTSVSSPVRAELKRGDMAVIRDESAPSGDKSLPVLYCSELIDAPAVRAAIAKAVARLAPAYEE